MDWHRYSWFSLRPKSFRSHSGKIQTTCHDRTGATTSGELDTGWIVEAYTDYKRPQLSQTTIAKDFERVRRNIKKFPSVKLADAVVIRDRLVKNTSPNTAKRVLSKLTSAYNWGILSNLVNSNPFTGMSADIISVNKSDGGDINAFTSEERNSIFQRFKDNGSHYASLVEFYILAAGLAVSVCGANIRPDRESSEGQLRKTRKGKKQKT